MCCPCFFWLTLWCSSVIQGAEVWHLSSDGSQLLHDSYQQLLQLDGQTARFLTTAGELAVDTTRIWRLAPADKTDPTLPPAASRFALALVSGDRWLASELQLQGEQFLLTLDERTKVRLPLEQVQRLSYLQPIPPGQLLVPAGPSPALSGDLAILANHDHLRGELTSFTEDHWRFRTQLGELELQTTQLSAIEFDPLLTAVWQPPRQGWVVQLTTGDRVTVEDLQLIGADQFRCLLSGGEPWLIPVTQVALLEPFHPRQQPVSWQPVASAQQRNYFGQDSSPLLNAAWGAQPLRSSNSPTHSCALGIGTRSASRITFRLPPRSTSLLVEVSLDPRVRDRGAVLVRIEGQRGDTVQALQAPLLLDQTQPAAVLGPLPVTQWEAISFVTDFGPRADLDDLVNWCSPVIRREPSAATTDTDGATSHELLDDQKRSTR